MMAINMLKNSVRFKASPMKQVDLNSGKRETKKEEVVSKKTAPKKVKK
jgi:hypothetical protein